MRRRTVVMLLAGAWVLCAAGAFAEEKILFDFEDPAQLQAWAMAAPPPPRRGRQPKPEPEAKLELATPPGGTGSALKITYAGGNTPTVVTKQVPEDLSAYKVIKFDLTASRPMLIGAYFKQEKAGRGGYRGSGWEATVYVPAGKSAVPLMIHHIGTRWGYLPDYGKVLEFGFYVYGPLEGDSVTLDNVRLSTEPDPKAANSAGSEWKARHPDGATDGFQVLGTDLKVADVNVLAAKYAEGWVKPEKDKTVAEREAEFDALYAQLKATHPKAMMVTFRQGQKGYDPANPEKEFAGWSDTYLNCHSPDGNPARAAIKTGDGMELFMRHRSQLMRIDVSSLPKGAKILAARLLVTATRAELASKPNMYVAEACNRPWVEGEANAYVYAKGKIWHSLSGRYYRGDDPDFWPIYLAFGPGQGKTSVWDFTEAVKWWTEGAHANHGFFLHGQPAWRARTFSPHSKELKNRPALVVIYEP